MSNIIEVDQLTKRYRKASVNAVDQISFSVKQGDFFALLGPNGAGKTTTISILTTTRSATSGKVMVDGFDAESQSAEVRARIGIIFQNPSLDMNLTAEENVRIHAHLYGLYPFRPSYRLMPSAYKSRIDELASVLGISEAMFKPVKTFSGGMRRKLEIVRSLMHKPKVLFLDEPTTGIDPISRRNLWEYLNTIRNETDTTIFLTTHYLEEAETADTICIIDRGQITAQGAPAALKSEFADQYLLIDADDRAALRAELNAKAIPFSEKGLFKLPFADSGAHALLKAIDTPLTRLETYSQTLEDTYLAIVEKVR